MTLRFLPQLLGLALLCVVPARAADTSAEPLPVETFFKEADATSMQVSPDGRHLAFLTTLGFGKVGIALVDLDKGPQPEALVSAKDENIKMFFWKGNDWIVYGGDLGGNESYALRSINIEPPAPGKKRKVIALSEAYKERSQDDADQAQIIDRLRFDPEHIMVFGRRETGSRSFGAYKLNIRNGTRTPVTSYDELPDYSSSSDVVDNNGVLRARSHTEKGEVIFEVRPRPDAPYEKVRSFSTGDTIWDFQFFAADNETLYLLDSSNTDTAVLRTLNVRTHELSAPIFRPDEGEITGVLSSWDRSILYGVYYNSDKDHVHFIDPARAKLQQTIDASLPGTINTVTSSSIDEKTMVIIARSDRDPGTWYLLKDGRLSRFARVHSQIDPSKMRPMEPIQYTARDGLVIHGYLTRPAASANGPVPLVLNPHGGPYTVRDDWGFNPEVQLFANRGYAVLQVNYRGSGGYGLAHQRAGYHEWGAKMQDDLTDAVQWAIKEGIADPKRVAIVGASYGGYAALAGAIFTPDLFCCAVNYVGVADLTSQVGNGTVHGDHGSEMFFEQMVGTDRTALKARSPINFVDRLKIPLFNAYGENDPRVKIEQWKKLKSKLDSNHKPYEIIIEDNEGHGFHNEARRIAYYKQVDAFLLKWLAPAR